MCGQEEEEKRRQQRLKRSVAEGGRSRLRFAADADDLTCGGLWSGLLDFLRASSCREGVVEHAYSPGVSVRMQDVFLVQFRKWTQGGGRSLQGLLAHWVPSPLRKVGRGRLVPTATHPLAAMLSHRAGATLSVILAIVHFLLAVAAWGTPLPQSYPTAATAIATASVSTAAAVAALRWHLIVSELAAGIAFLGLVACAATGLCYFGRMLLATAALASAASAASAAGLTVVAAGAGGGAEGLAAAAAALWVRAVADLCFGLSSLFLGEVSMRPAVPVYVIFLLTTEAAVAPPVAAAAGAAAAALLRVAGLTAALGAFVAWLVAWALQSFAHALQLDLVRPDREASDRSAPPSHPHPAPFGSPPPPHTHVSPFPSLPRTA